MIDVWLSNVSNKSEEPSLHYVCISICIRYPNQVVRVSCAFFGENYGQTTRIRAKTRTLNAVGGSKIKEMKSWPSKKLACN